MINRTKVPREFYAKKLALHFGIDLNNKDLKIVSVLGGYIKKMELIFKSNQSKISFNFHENNKISSNLFNHNKYKRNTGNTYYYVWDAINMFGMMSDTRYNEDEMVKEGWELKDLVKYDSFEEYLIGADNFSNITSGKFDTKIFTSIYVYMYGETTKLKSITSNYGSNFKAISSDFKGLFDHLYLYIFKERNPYHGMHFSKNMTARKTNTKIKTIIDKEDSKLKKLANIIKNVDNPAEEKRLINYNRQVIKLRRIHREDLKEQFNTFKDVHNIIDKYITTYNLEKQFGNVQEAAHIIAVSDLVKEGRFEDIGNKENGILLDPTTHKMFDKGLLLFSGDNTKLISYPEKFPFEFEYKIPNGLLTDSRIEYIKEWKERFQKDND